MKLCAACCEEQPKEKFSKKQWQLKQYQRRCKDCINDNRDAKMTKPPSTHELFGESPSCWICLEEGPDESGQPLRRDCSCRGDSGFAHLSCIGKYAEQKFKDLSKKIGPDFWEKVQEPWEDCPNCQHGYRNRLAVDLADKFMSLVEEKHPYNLGSVYNQLINMEANITKLQALTGTITAWFEAGDIDKFNCTAVINDAKQVANKIISITGHLKAVHPTIQSNDAFVYDCLGNLTRTENGGKCTQSAMEYYEKSRDLYNLVGFTDSATRMKFKIARAKNDEGSDCELDVQDQYEHSKCTYDRCVKEFGKESSVTLKAGIGLASVHIQAQFVVSAERLLTELLETSLRAHGPGHNLTKLIEHYLGQSRIRTVVLESSAGGQELFRFLQYQYGGTRCLVRGPVGFSARPDGVEKTFTIATNDVFVFSAGSPIICHGLQNNYSGWNGKVAFVQSFDEETKNYHIIFEDDSDEQCLLKWNQFRVLFELPRSELE